MATPRLRLFQEKPPYGFCGSLTGSTTTGWRMSAGHRRSKVIPARGRPGEAESAEVFQWLTSLRARFSGDPQLDLFLELLDGFWIGGYGLPHLLEELRNPTPRMNEHPRLPDTALLGMFRFLNLCTELGAGLSEMEFAPRTRAMIWISYAHWSGAVKLSLTEVMESTLERIQLQAQAQARAGKAGGFTVKAPNGRWRASLTEHGACCW